MSIFSAFPLPRSWLSPAIDNTNRNHLRKGTKMAQITIDTEKMSEVTMGSNVKAVMEGDLLILVVDTTKDLGVSSTGKMRACGNTGGFQGLPGGLKGNVYIGRKI
jgi:hypothetical protein